MKGPLCTCSLTFFVCRLLPLALEEKKTCGRGLISSLPSHGRPSFMFWNPWHELEDGLLRQLGRARPLSWRSAVGDEKTRRTNS